MSIVAWVVLGLLAGFIANKLIYKSGSGVVTDMLLGIIGALVGGFVFRFFGLRGFTGFNLWSLFVAVAGSVLLLVGYRAINRR